MIKMKKMIPFIIIPILLVGCTFKTAQKNVALPSNDTNIVALVNNSSIAGLSEEDDDKKYLQEEKVMRKVNRANAIAKAQADERAKLQVQDDEKVQVEETVNLQAQEDVKVKSPSKAPVIQAQAKVQAKTHTPKVGNPQPTQKPATITPTQISNKYDVEYLTKVANEIVTLCNAERVKVGVAALSNNETLRKIAEYKSNEMLQYEYFAHVSPITGFAPSILGNTFGWYSGTFGENIIMNGSSDAKSLKTTTTAQGLVTQWMNSPGHKANILNNKFTKIGVGITFSSIGKVYGTQSFSN